MRVFLANAKGGCGKTTAAVTLAVALARAGHRVLLADADRQGSASAWHARRPRSLAPPIPLAALGKLSRLDRLEPEAGPAVVDCRAGLDPEALGERLRRGDLVLVPVLPSPLDLEASLAFLRGLAREGQVARGRAGVLVFLNRSRPEGRATAAVRAALAEAGWPPRAEIREASAYALAGFLGKSLFDYEGEAARERQRDWEPLLAAIAEAAPQKP